MNSTPYITNAPLPLDQSFRLLKQQGLDYVQQHCDNEWTNLNPSDPGVTILDQVCYALTELGYCNSFPIEDILASHDGTIEIRNWFYTPGEILTTAPVTVNDYRRYLVDGVDGVTNAVILPDTDAVTRCSLYRVYLQLAAALANNEEAIADTCKAAFYYLNKSRNTGELFAMPEPLQPVTYILSSVKVEITDSEKVYELLKALNDAVCNYIFPVVIQSNYSFTASDNINESYNGPLLQHGTIFNEELGQKRNVLYATDLVLLAENIPGIVKVTIEGPGFTPAPPDGAVSGNDQLIVIDLPGSVNNGLQVWCNGKLLHLSAIKLQQVLNSSAKKMAAAYFEVNAVKEPPLPKGRFRDIASYYSIQNTFPDIFAVGANSVLAHASAFQVAQSRQLKGYLTLFDQVLANQFAQLAGVGSLFSFNNTATANRDGDGEYLLPDGERVPLEKAWPAGYQSFSPTYFFQPLYHVPHIRPLLKGNETFNFSDVEQEAKEQAHKSWLAYQSDPYNAYIRGLMDCMEDKGDNLERRNNILDHLLARHGESPLIIDTCAEAYAYTGNRLQGLIIIKSLYLQNLGLLSYNRQKAYNYIGANKLDAALSNVPVKVEEEMVFGNSSDFIFNTKAANREEKLVPQHFIQYSALELKLNLWFALRVRYEQFIVTHYSEPARELEVQIAYWLIRQRRGSILIEEGLLLHSAAISKQEQSLFPGNSVWIFLPDFLFPVDPAFKDRLYFFLQQELPVQLPFQCHFVSSDMMAILIPAFCEWHNSLVYKDDDPVSPADITMYATRLIEILTQINARNA